MYSEKSMLLCCLVTKKTPGSQSKILINVLEEYIYFSSNSDFEKETLFFVCSAMH